MLTPMVMVGVLVGPFLPMRYLAVITTGLLEIGAAVAILHPEYRSRVGWLLLVMLIGFLPFTIYSALNHVSMGGRTWGPVYLWFRVPLQLALMSWTYRFAIRSKST